MDRIVAFCGVICTDCTAYLATQANDLAAQERIAALWRDAFDTPDIGVADIICDGCAVVGGRLSGYCRLCEIRQCGLQHGVPNCAHCIDYPCDELEAFFEKMERFFQQHDGFLINASDARAVLDEIHRSR